MYTPLNMISTSFHFVMCNILYHFIILIYFVSSAHYTALIPRVVGLFITLVCILLIGHCPTSILKLSKYTIAKSRIIQDLDRSTVKYEYLLTSQVSSLTCEA